MDCCSVQNTFLLILLALLVGQGDGRWKKSNREMLQHDVKLFKKMTEKIKDELGAYYEEYSDEPFADYFFEEIDYLQSRIERNMNRKTRTGRRKEINNSNFDDENNSPQRYTKNVLKNIQASVKNVTFESSDRSYEWPSFEDILSEMGKKYDWKNDRWIKVRTKIKRKNEAKPTIHSKSSIEHLKHNFRYRIVKLNRGKSKRNVVVAVTAVR
ncbi:uncharacterized protein LOC120629594 [Pararge aegeria]|uniref:Jg20643 protein n=1 Tax=Pararge aegeria aegeria TaxID=348720 RepID=A0A8S4REE7_9NEOP|nr:uncharacterized protein LOC120629594 [Pararge aegeria]CAH2235268.1 jg20643 [Pararge aegeria aegeria]